MSILNRVEHFSFGMLPFSYGSNKTDKMPNTELVDVRRAKIFGATVMTSNAIWDISNISNTITEIFSSTNTDLAFSDMSKDALSLVASVVWITANVNWIKRHETITN